MPPPPKGHPLPHRPPQQATCTHSLLSLLLSPHLWRRNHSLCSFCPPLLQQQAPTPCWQSHSTFNDYLLGPVTLRAFTACIFSSFPLFPSSIPSRPSVLHTCFSPASRFSCHLVQAAFLIISAGTANSTVLASNLRRLPQNSSGSLGWFMAMLKQPVTGALSMASRSGSPNPFPVPSTPLAEAFLSHPSNWTPLQLQPHSPPLPSLFPADQGIILQLTLFHGSHHLRDEVLALQQETLLWRLLSASILSAHHLPVLSPPAFTCCFTCAAPSARLSPSPGNGLPLVPRICLAR